MAVEYFDDLPKWLHEMLTDSAQQDAEQAAKTESAEAAAKGSPQKRLNKNTPRGVQACVR